MGRARAHSVPSSFSNLLSSTSKKMSLRPDPDMERNTIVGLAPQRGHGFGCVDAVHHENRPDQVIDRQGRFAHQPSHGIAAFRAAKARHRVGGRDHVAS